MAVGLLPGVRVFDLGQRISAPYCAKILAQMGAEVIKVEPPEGDAARRMGPFPDDIPHPEKSGCFWPPASHSGRRTSGRAPARTGRRYNDADGAVPKASERHGLPREDRLLRGDGQPAHKRSCQLRLWTARTLQTTRRVDGCRGRGRRLALRRRLRRRLAEGGCPVGALAPRNGRP